MSMCTCIGGTKTHNQVSSYTYSYSHQVTNRHIDFDMDIQVLGVNSWQPATQSLNETGSDRLSPLATTNFLLPRAYLEISGEGVWAYMLFAYMHWEISKADLECLYTMKASICSVSAGEGIKKLRSLTKGNGHYQEGSISSQEGAWWQFACFFLCFFCQKQISTWSFAVQRRPIKPIEMLPFTSVYRRCWRQWWSSPWERARRLLPRPQ